MGEILFLGVVISIIYFEITEISPGGLVVPGMLAFYFDQPERILFTLAIAIGTYYFVKFISNFMIIYGKRKFVVTIFCSILLYGLVSLFVQGLTIEFLDIAIIGYVIPGIIANDFNKQGIKKTLPSLLIVTCIIKLVLIVVS